MPNLKNPTTGATQSVSEEDAGILRRGGWVDETPSEGGSRVIGERERERFTSTRHEVGAVVKGGLSGLSLGLTDLAFNDEDSQKEAEYNPGLRTGAELVGGLLPAFVGGEGSVLKAIGEATPVGRVMGAGARIREGLGGVKGAVAAGAFEGGAFAAGGVLSRAQLTDDPITVESVIGGVGLGAFIGAGAGLVGGGLIKGGQQAESSIASERAEELLGARSPELQSMAQTARDAAREAQGQLRATADTLKAAARAAKEDAISAANFRPGEVLGGIKKAENEITVRAGVQGGPEAAAVMGKLRGAFNKAAQTAAFEKDIKKVYAAVEAYHSTVAEVGREFSVTPPALGNRVGDEMRAQVVAAGKKAANDAADISHLPSSLKLAPSSPQALASMGDARAEAFFKGVQSVLDTKNPALQPLSLQMKEQVEQVLSRHNIVVPPGTSPVDGMRALRLSLRRAAADVKKPVTGIAQMLADRGFKKASLAAGVLMGRRHPISAGLLIADALGYRSAVGKVTRDMMAALGGPVGRGAIKIAGPGARLGTSIFGAPDKAGDIRQLVANRANEVTRLSGGAHRDMLYAATAPIAAHSQAFAVSLMNLGARAVEYLAQVAPKDPGGGGAFQFGRWDRGWLPSRNQAMQFAAVHEAVVAPMDAMQRMVAGSFEPAAADALWAVYPAMMQRAQAEMVYVLSSDDPPHLNLAQRSALGTAFRVPLDGLCRPEAIAALQMSYMPPDPTQVASAGQQSSRGPGRPAATEKTQVQKLQD